MKKFLLKIWNAIVNFFRAIFGMSKPKKREFTMLKGEVTTIDALPIRNVKVTFTTAFGVMEGETAIESYVATTGSFGEYSMYVPFVDFTISAASKRFDFGSPAAYMAKRLDQGPIDFMGTPIVTDDV